MRFNVSLAAGAIAGASVGLVCLCLAGPAGPASRFDPARVAATRRAPARAAADLPRLRADPRAPGAAPGRATPASAGRTAPGGAPAPSPGPAAPSIDFSKRAAKPAFAARGLAGAPALGPAGAAAAAGAPTGAPGDAKASPAPIGDRLKAGISGFHEGVDLARPVSLAGGVTTTAPLTGGGSVGAPR